MKELSEQNVLCGELHKPFTGLRPVKGLSFCAGSKTPKSQTSFINLKTKGPCVSTNRRVLAKCGSYPKLLQKYTAMPLPPLLQHTAYTIFLLHLVLFLIRKEILPKG